MFWGLIMEPQRRYTQKVKKAFHISMAAIDLASSGDEPAQVMCTYDGRNYLLCTLRKPDLLQCILDLNFDVGNEVSFATNGNSHIHLTGYLVEDADDFGGEEIDEEDVEVQFVERKKRRKGEVNGPPQKKVKNYIEAVEEEEDSDDSDFDLEKALEAADEEDSTVVEEEEEDDDDEEDEEEAEDEENEAEEDGEESEDEESVEEEQPPQKKHAKMNGVAKKQQNKVETPTKQQKVQESKKQKKQQQQQQQQQQAAPKKRTLQGGVTVEDIKEGQGNPAKNGRFVNVYYEGRLKQNNKLFDSTTKGAGFSFRLGSGEVIKAWDVGVAGMKVGGKRRIICPPSMAYGQKGSPPAIPPNSTLVFEVELKKIS